MHRHRDYRQRHRARLLTYLSGMTAGNGGGSSAAVIQGDVVVTGDVVANGISLTSHVHPDLTSGGKTGRAGIAATCISIGHALCVAFLRPQDLSA